MSSRSSRSTQKRIKAANAADRDADAQFAQASSRGSKPMMTNKDQIKLGQAGIKNRMKANKLRAIDAKPKSSKKYENQT